MRSKRRHVRCTCTQCSQYENFKAVFLPSFWQGAANIGIAAILFIGMFALCFLPVIVGGY